MSEFQGDLPWLIGLFCALVFFIVFETRGFQNKNNTLSHFIYTIGAKFPLSIFIMGQTIGILCAHFFWHWCPPGSLSSG